MSEKTEQPTEKKKHDARSKGQGVGRSHELAMGMTLGASVLGLSILLPGASDQLAATLRSSIQSIGNGPASSGELTASIGTGMSQWLSIVVPLALMVGFVGAVSNVASGGLVLSMHSIRFDPSRLNPMAGLKRLVDKQVAVRLGIALGKLTILASVGWLIASAALPKLLALGDASVPAVTGVALDAMYRLGLAITVPVAILAFVDFFIQRRRAKGTLKMTKEEVKRESREQEGDPIVRNARRRRARQMAMQRMMQAVATADVIVTNPTRLAVALKYDSLTMRAPRIVAKGQRLMAARIRQIAKENGVPIIEDKPLARALFPRPLGSEVPGHLYSAVARLLVMVQQARFGLYRSAPRPAASRPATGPRPISPSTSAGATGARPTNARPGAAGPAVARDLSSGGSTRPAFRRPSNAPGTGPTIAGGPV